jgi:hypothetical protein
MKAVSLGPKVRACVTHSTKCDCPTAYWAIIRWYVIWVGGESNPGGDEIFRTHPDRPWRPPRFLYNGYRVSFPEVRQRRSCVNHPPPSSVEVKERIELNLKNPPPPLGIWRLQFVRVIYKNHVPTWQTGVRGGVLLRYKSEVSGFHSRWSPWDFSVT